MTISRRTFIEMVGATVPALAVGVPAGPAPFDLRVLEHVTACVRAMAPRFRSVALASVARRWAAAGLASHATQLRAEALAGVDSCSPDVQAVVLATVAAAARARGEVGGEELVSRAVELAGKAENGNARERLYERVLEAFEESPDELVAHRVLAAIAKEDPRRSALAVSRCARHLRFVRDDALSSALAYASDPRVFADAHYLAGAVSACATLAEGRRVDLPSTTVAAISRHLRDDLEDSHRLPNAVVRLGRHDLLEPIVGTGVPATFSAILCWTAVAGEVVPRPSVATFRAVREAAWSLPIEDSQRRALVRLIRLMPIFEPGDRRVLDEVLQRAAATKHPYLLSEAGLALIPASSTLDPADRVDFLAGMRGLLRAALGGAGDRSFLFDVAALSIRELAAMRSDRAEADIRALIELVEEAMEAPYARHWSGFYRHRALIFGAHALISLGHLDEGAAMLEREIDGALKTLHGLDVVDAVMQAAPTISLLPADKRIALFDRLFATPIQSESAPMVIALLIDRV